MDNIITVSRLSSSKISEVSVNCILVLYHAILCIGKGRMESPLILYILSYFILVRLRQRSVIGMFYGLPKEREMYSFYPCWWTLQENY